MKVCVVLVLCTVSIVAVQASNQDQSADVIFLHGNVYTGNEGAAKREQAIAVRDHHIQAVGSDKKILAFKGPKTTIVDLGNHFVMPGFNDAHLHLAGGGLQKLTVNLDGTKSLAEFRDRIRSHVKTAIPQEWITGGGWDETKWTTNRLPSRKDLDEITTEHPIFLHRTDGHIAVANSLALKVANITPTSPDPAGGRIDRDADGQPTGILREGAKNAVIAVIPPPTHARRRQAIELVLQELSHAGITSVQDNSPWEDFLVYEELERDGKLTVRITEWLPFKESIGKLKEQRAAHSQSDEMLHTGMLKAFMDGSLGSRTAAMLSPYSDDPKNSGLAQFEQAELNQMTKDRLANGFQMGFHAIGDKGVQMALDAFAEAEKQTSEVKAPDGSQNFRLRIEHAQVTNPEQIARFKELNVIASMQPNHLLTDLIWAESRLGAERAEGSYAWAAFLKKGVPLAFGTDYPVEAVAPFRGLYSAVTRKSEDGKKEYFPQQKLTIEQAIAAYTTGSAYAEFAEKNKGKIATGMLADLVVLDRDLTAIAPEEILGTKVLRTVLGGKTIYQSR
jgi:predicted amidohydrolase YtcJ